MDLTIKLDVAILNIRVAVLMETSKGYLFEKSPEGYYYVLGGRIKAKESSFEAAKREILEEIGYEISNLKLISMVENFFVHKDSPVQEICFVYKYEKVIEIDLPNNIIAILQSDLAEKNILPEIIKKIIIEENVGISHYIVK